VAESRVDLLVGTNRSGDLIEPTDFEVEIGSKVFNDGRRRNAEVLERELSRGSVAGDSGFPSS
jgi:hypothetical protein